MNKNLISQSKMMIFLSIVLIGVFAFQLLNDFNIFSLATDSGFDTSYDSGGSWDSGSSYDYGGGYSSSGRSSGKASTLETVIILVIVTPFLLILLISFIFMLVDAIRSTPRKEKIRIAIKILWYLYVPFGFMFTFSAFLESYTLAFLFMVALDILFFKIYRKYNPKKRDNIRYNYDEELPVTEENKHYLDEAYQIFVDVQNAWMNFDYDTLRKLVDDKLYNTYKSQLETLSIKNQKNIMFDFNLLDSGIKNIQIHEHHTIVQIRLQVSFYDYIADEKGKVVRGKKNKRVYMEYSLSFIIDKDSSVCPNCQAALEPGETICSYCHSHIQAPSNTMKLMRKNVIRQSDRKF